MEFLLPHNSFQGNTPLSVNLPDDWDIEYYPLPGDSMKELSYAEIIKKIEHPYGCKPLSLQAKGKQKVCILFDDITRGTPTKLIAEAVVSILIENGVEKENIEFICALGTHGAHNRFDHVQKLGEDIVRTFPVYNHNCYENTVCIGKTHRGIPVSINREFTLCDLRIGIGAITPHTMNGFGGGGKILFPGIASIDTIAHNHKTATEFLEQNCLNSSAMTGHIEMRGMREEIEEMTRMAGPFFKIDCLYNSNLEIIDLYAGEPIEEYYAAIPAAQKVYSIPQIKDKDVVIVNVNAKASEATIATGFGALAVRHGGDVVVIDMTKRGQATHYLFGAFGRSVGGRMMGKMPSVRPNVNQYYFLMPYPDIGSCHWFGELEKQVFADSWEEILSKLRAKHGSGAKIAVVSDGTLAYYAY